MAAAYFEHTEPSPVLMFLAGVFLATRYNKPGRRLAARDLRVNVAVFAVGLVACLLLSDQQVAVNCISSLMLVAHAAYMLYLLKRKAYLEERGASG